MKVIITESQKDKMLLNLIKEKGFSFTSNIVGGPKNLLSILGIDSPMDFLHLFDDLDITRSDQKPYWITFKHKTNYNIMVYDDVKNNIYINYREIFETLGSGFGLTVDQMQSIVKKWLYETYNIKVDLAFTFSPPQNT